MKRLVLFYTVMMSAIILFSQTMTLDLPDIDNAVPGENVIVPIIVAETDGKYSAFEIFVEYNPEVLTPVTEQNIHPNFQASPWTNNPNYSSFEWHLTWTDGNFCGGQSIEPGEVLIELVFDYNNSGGYSNLVYGQSEEKGLTVFLSSVGYGFQLYDITFLEGYVSDGLTLFNESEIDNVRIWPNNQSIYVNVPGSADGKIQVFNLMSQEIFSTDIKHGLNKIPIDQANTYYIVRVKASDNVVTEKVFVN